MKVIQRSLITLGLTLLAVAVAIGVLRQGSGPNPITDLDAWVRWVTADPISSFVGLAGAAMAGIGGIAGLLQISSPKPQSRDEAARGHDRIRAAVEDEAEATRRDIEAMEARIIAQLSGPHARGERVDEVANYATAEAVRSITRAGDPAEQAAARLIAEGRVEEGFAHLRDDARASVWRDNLDERRATIRMRIVSRSVRMIVAARHERKPFNLAERRSG